MVRRPAQDSAAALNWLRTGPTLRELRERYPAEWQALSDQPADIFASGKPEMLRDFMRRLGEPAAAGAPRAETDTLSRLVRQRMAHLALKNYLLYAAVGGKGGKLRFNWLNGFIAQKLLFAHDLVRKPVSPFWFSLFWPLLRQRALLMPLVEPKGIYCFYGRPLIDGLARLIGARECLEIAAGDGTLSRFLAGAGVKITASDDHSWRHAVDFPESVVKLDASQALRRHRPRVVVCSWPPANNRFERDVFKQASVELYVVIGSRHEFASGNWRDYRAQSTFDMIEDKHLGRWVLPPELGATVYLFQRREGM
jgi:hypothetical protein